MRETISQNSEASELNCNAICDVINRLIAILLFIIYQLSKIDPLISYIATINCILIWVLICYSCSKNGGNPPPPSL